MAHACFCLAETISPRQLVEVADLGFPVISPDGRSAAFRLEQASVERNTYDTVWYVQDLHGNTPPRRVADGGIPLRDSAGGSLVTPAVWSPDGRSIYYRAFLEGRIDIWRALVDGSDVEPVTLDPADVREFSLSADGRTLMYSVGATREEVKTSERAEYDHGIRIDETSPIGQPLFRSGYIGDRLATQRFGGVWFDRTPLLADVPDRWKAIDLTTRERRDLSPSEIPLPSPRPSDLIQGAWARASDPASGRVALLTRTSDGQSSHQTPDVGLVVLVDSDSNRSVRCASELCTQKSITSIQWRPNSDEVLFTVTDAWEGLAQSIFRWDVETGVVYPVVRSSGLLSGGRNYFESCGISSEALACVAAEADQPPRLERIDLETGDRQVLFDPNVALALNMSAERRSRLLRWTDVSGQAFTGHFFPARRVSDALPPLFVTYYSCPGFLRGGVGDEWPLSPLAANGISALCINRAPSRPVDRIEIYDQALSAVESVVDLLASEGEIDRTKVGMGGLSFGSAVTLWTVAESDLLAAASVTSPVVSPNYYLLSSLKGDIFSQELGRTWGLGSPDKTPERWRRLSPAFNLDKMQAPILMQMPELEYIHSLDYAIPLIREHLADLYVFPHEPHIKFQPRHKLAAYQRNLDWFRFWLQDYEDPDPAKREQYAHWREMRDAQRKTP